MSSIGIELPKEIKRNQEILAAYQKIGAPGVFAATMIKADINEGINALASGDCIRMIQVYQTLKDNKY